MASLNRLAPLNKSKAKLAPEKEGTFTFEYINSMLRNFYLKTSAYDLSLDLMHNVGVRLSINSFKSKGHTLKDVEILDYLHNSCKDVSLTFVKILCFNEFILSSKLESNYLFDMFITTFACIKQYVLYTEKKKLRKAESRHNFILKMMTKRRKSGVSQASGIGLNLGNKLHNIGNRKPAQNSRKTSTNPDTFNKESSHLEDSKNVFSTDARLFNNSLVYYLNEQYLEMWEELMVFFTNQFASHLNSSEK